MRRWRQIVLLSTIAIVGAFLITIHVTALVKANSLELREGSDIVFTAPISTSEVPANLFRVELSHLADSLLRANPHYRSVSCRCDFRGNIICVAERTRPVALIATPDIYGLTARCEFIPDTEIANTVHLPLISGVDPGKIKPYARSRSEAVKSAMALLREIRGSAPELYAMISQVDYSGEVAPGVRIGSGKRERRARITACRTRASRTPRPTGRASARQARSARAT